MFCKVFRQLVRHEYFSPIRNLPVLRLDHPIRNMEIPVVMGDGNNGLALRFERRQQSLVKVLPEMRVLPSCPLIKDGHCMLITVFRSRTVTG